MAQGVTDGTLAGVTDGTLEEGRIYIIFLATMWATG